MIRILNRIQNGMKGEDLGGDTLLRFLSVTQDMNVPNRVSLLLVSSS